MSLWQTSSWQEMLLESGQTEDFFEVEFTPERGESVNIYIEQRSIGLGQTGLFIIGLDTPIFYNPDTGEIVDDFSQFLQGFLRTTKALFLQVESYNIGEYPEGYHGEAYKKFIPRYTAFIDLSKTLDDILADMKPKGRYNIRLAEKKGVTTRELETTAENVEKFYTLMQETTSRDTFAGNSLTYYETFLRMIPGAKLYTAEHEGDTLAMGIFVHHDKKMIYYYGASSSEKRNLMAPYALQWFAIEEGKRLGATMYDFLGVAGDDEPDSSLAGVTDFKMKLSPHKYHISESELLISRPKSYRVFETLKKFKQKFL